MTGTDGGTVGEMEEAQLVTPPEYGPASPSTTRPLDVPDHRPSTPVESTIVPMPAPAPDAPLPARSGPTPRVLWPTESDAEDDVHDPAPAPRRLPGGWLRAAYVGAAFAGAFGAYAMLGPRRSGSTTREAAADLLPVEARLDARVDTLARALAAFDLRAQLFDARQMTCEDLARGLVQIDDQWIAYNAVRKVAPATLDSARTVYDRVAQTNVRAAERRFERSACARP